MPITTATLDDTLAAIEKQYGKGFIHRANEVPDVYRLPSRSLNFNRATGGGIPFGRWSQFWGNFRSLKTSVAYELIAQAQDIPHSIERYLMPRIRYCREIGDSDHKQRLTEELEFYKDTFPEGCDAVLYNSEQVADKDWMAQKGIDVDRLLVVESTTIEDIAGSMEALFQHVPMHVVDSTTNCTSLEEQNMKMSDRRIGLDARVWKQSLRKVGHFWNYPDGLDAPPRNFNIGILITQSSINFRTGGEQPVSARYIGHISSMTLHFQRGRFLYAKGEDGQLIADKPTGADDQSFAGRVEADGAEIFIEVDKSRVGRLGRKARLESDYRTKDFDHLGELVNAAIHHGIAVQSGSAYRVGDDEKSVRGVGALRKRISEDPALEDQIIATVMASIEDD